MPVQESPPVPESTTVIRPRHLLMLGLCVALPRLVLMTAGPDAHLSWMVDDASYYLEAARRSVTEGGWPSVDGRHATNGFHPLYMAVLMAIQWLAGTEPRVVVPIVMGLNLALNAVSVLWLVRVMSRRPSGIGWFVPAVLLLLGPGWLAHGTLGVENSLSALLVLAAVLRWEERFGEGAPAASWRARAVDGGLLGLAILGRTDSAILALAWLAFAARSVHRERGARAAMAETAVIAAALAITLAPWCALSWWKFQTLVQDSGSALAARFATDYGPRLSGASLKAEALGLGFWVYRFLWAGGLIPLTGWLWGLAAPAERWRRPGREHAIAWAVLGASALLVFVRGNDPTDIRVPRMAAVELGAGALAFLGGLSSPRPAGVVWRPVFTMVSVAMGLQMLAYAVGFRGFQVWYATGLSLSGVLLVCSAALPGALAGRRLLASGFLLLMVLQCSLVMWGWFTRGALEGMDRDTFARGDSLRVRLERFVADSPVPLRFGSFDSGELGYRIHPFPIVNTDGVMNHSAAVAIRRGELARYLRADGITHLITSPLRIAQYRRIEDFPAVPDSAASRAIGLLVWRLEPQP